MSTPHKNGKRFVGRLITRQLQDHNSSGSEIGHFDLDVYVSERSFLTSGDKKGFVRNAIATHLASAIIDSTVPAEYWAFFPEPKIAAAFRWPKTMPMG